MLQDLLRIVFLFVVLGASSNLAVAGQQFRLAKWSAYSLTLNIFLGDYVCASILQQQQQHQGDAQTWFVFLTVQM